MSSYEVWSKAHAVDTPSYSERERAILDKIKLLIGGTGQPYSTSSDIDATEKTRRMTVVGELSLLVRSIRQHTLSPSDFFSFQDAHFDQAEYVFLQEKHPGLNVNGWRLFMALMDPVTYGQNIDRPIETVRGRISKRS